MAYDYAKTLSRKELEKECHRCWDEIIDLNQALIDLPEVPSIRALQAIDHAAMNIKGIDFWSIAKDLQRKHGSEKIPFKAEYEHAAGLWSIIREGVMSAKG